MQKRRWLLAAILTVPIGVSFTPGVACASVDLVNDQGATAPCIGIGPLGGPAAESCGKLFEQNGFLRIADAGVTGLGLGSGAQDGVIISVAPGSAAEKAGLIAGDVVVEVGGDAVTPQPGAVAAQHLFGRWSDKAKVHIRRDGVEMDLVMSRSPVRVAGAPASTNPFVAVKPMVDWRGRFIPCVAIGPLGFAAVGFCNNHFKSFGYVPVADAGRAGVELDMSRTDKAMIKSVDTDRNPAGPLRAGDEIISVDGAKIAASRSDVASTALFGKVGQPKSIKVLRGGKLFAATVVLAARA